MNKIPSTTSSGAQLNDTDDAPPTVPERSMATKVRDAGLMVLGGVVDGCSTLVPFSGDGATAMASDGLQWATHDSNDVESFAKRLMADPKKTMASADPLDAAWYFRQFSDGQRAAALEAFAKAGLTKKVDGQQVPAGAPKPPALYEVNDKQAPATKDFIHGMNVIAARNYDDAYDRQASLEPNPDKVGPYVNLEEPGTHASLEEGMSRTIARGVDDYVVGTLHDVESMFSVARQTRKLAVGDEMQLQGGADGVFGGPSLGGSLSVKVKRGSDGYRVSPQGSLSTGVKLGENTVSGGVSWGGEYRCKTVNEVDQLTTILARQAKGDTISKADQDFLNERVSGLDLKGSVAAKLIATLEDDQNKKNVKFAAGLKEETSLHLDLDARTVTVSRKYSGDASGQFGSHQGIMPDDPKSKMTNSFDSGVGADVTVTTKYTLPPGTSWESFKATPGATLNAVAKQNLDPETSVKVHLQAGSRAVDVEGKTKDVDLQSVVGAFTSGGPKAAAQKLVDESKATVKVDRLKTSGISVGPKIGSSLDALSVSLKAQRTHHDVTQAASLKQALSELAG